MSDKVSQCSVCNELLFESGNYSVTIIPAKRIPKKANKVHLDSSISAWGMTKFQKYLTKRAIPKNICEITCGTCGTTCKIPMVKKKKLQALRKQTPSRSASSTPLNLSLDMNMTPTSTKSKRKKKRGKDVNAGLIIPESFRPSPHNQSSSQSNVATSSPSQDNRSSSNNRGARTSNQNQKSNESKLLATRNALQRSLLTGPNASSLDKFFS